MKNEKHVTIRYQKYCNRLLVCRTLLPFDFLETNRYRTPIQIRDVSADPPSKPCTFLGITQLFCFILRRLITYADQTWATKTTVLEGEGERVRGEGEGGEGRGNEERCKICNPKKIKLQLITCDVHTGSPPAYKWRDMTWRDEFHDCNRRLKVFAPPKRRAQICHDQSHGYGVSKLWDTFVSVFPFSIAITDLSNRIQSIE